MKSFIADKNGKLSKLALNIIDDLSYSALMKSLRKKDVKVNGKRVSSDITICAGDRVEIYYSALEQLKYNEIYIDDNILIVDKLVGYTSESVFDSVKKRYSNAYFIHRLDRNTSGLMVFALNEKAEKELVSGFKNRTFEKYYLATVVGAPKVTSATLLAYLFKDEKNALVTVTDKPVKGSVQIKTGYELLQNNGETSLLKITLYTGKTHQIRAHLAHEGLPVVGDGKYGDFEYNQRVGANRQALNANELVFHFEKQSPLFYLDKKVFKSKL